MGRNLLASKINDLEDDGKQQGYYAGPLPTKDGLLDDKKPVADWLHRMPVPAELRGRDRGHLKS